MKKSQQRFHRVNRALFLSLSNAFEEQKFIPKNSPKNFSSAPRSSKIVCGGQCAWRDWDLRNIPGGILGTDMTYKAYNRRKEVLIAM